MCQEFELYIGNGLIVEFLRMTLNFHCWANSQYDSLEYCGSSSIITFVGIPYSENTCLVVETSMWLLVSPVIWKFTVVISNY